MKNLFKNKILFLLLLTLLLTGCTSGEYIDNTTNNKSLDSSGFEDIKSQKGVEESFLNNTLDERDNSSSLEEKTDEPNLSNDSYYVNTDGEKVHSPAHAPSKPSGATAKCRDGTYSFSHSRRGTCSHHGGVAVWY